MKLSCEAFIDGGAMPVEFTRAGEGRSPPLNWTDPPDATRSFVLLVDDLDARAGVLRLWACYDIPAHHRDLVEGAGWPHSFEDFRHGLNDFDDLGYGPPGPPDGKEWGRCRFRLLALDCSELSIRTHPGCLEVETAARAHLLAQARLIGLYHR
jgi:Raf kinase inhibitor-like YbhB/YbcL family protein